MHVLSHVTAVTAEAAPSPVTVHRVSAVELPDVLSDASPEQLRGFTAGAGPDAGAGAGVSASAAAAVNLLQAELGLPAQQPAVGARPGADSVSPTFSDDVASLPLDSGDADHRHTTSSVEGEYMGEFRSPLLTPPRVQAPAASTAADAPGDTQRAAESPSAWLSSSQNAIADAVSTDSDESDDDALEYRASWAQHSGSGTWR